MLAVVRAQRMARTKMETTRFREHPFDATPDQYVSREGAGARRHDARASLRMAHMFIDVERSSEIWAIH
jgi:hypothetical protein